jgi:hypothetical protein
MREGQIAFGIIRGNKKFNMNPIRSAYSKPEIYLRKFALPPNPKRQY